MTESVKTQSKLEILKQLVLRNWKTSLAGLLYLGFWVYTHPDVMEALRHAATSKDLLVVVIAALSKDGDAPHVQTPRL